ncbi:unnamed protein product [Diatraea saccharalis]|uniref:Uncharacterized protein n=1 Tax=Diatraea saccharalis TaxID=40085 RepID=A0A9N9WD35_9NEOP|nr:unnamed protein product [Diatraea saccharalis]
MATMCVTSILAAQDDLGPHQFVQNTPSSLDVKPGYVMKDVILYLTPTQIKALEATQGLNKVVPYSKPNENQNERVQLSSGDIQKLEDELNRQLERLRIYERQNDKPAEVKEPPPIVEANTEESVPFSPQANQQQTIIPQIKPQQEPDYFLPNEQVFRTKLPESYSYIKFYTDNEPVEKINSEAFQAYSDEFKLAEKVEHNSETQQPPNYQKPYKLIPYEYSSNKSPEQLKEALITQVPQWPNLFEELKSEPSTNPVVSELLKSQNQESKPKEYELHKEFSDIKYVPKFDNHKQAADFQRFITKIEKDNALAKADALRVPIRIASKKEEAAIKLKRIPGLRRFNVPYLKPFYNH